MLNKNEQENFKKKTEGQEETSPAFTVMMCGVNPMPAGPTNRKAYNNHIGFTYSGNTSNRHCKLNLTLAQ